MDLLPYLFTYTLGIFTGIGLYKNATPILRVLGLFDTVSTVRMTKTFEAPIPMIILEPAHRHNMWRSYMRAFLFHAEMCEVTDRSTPANARALRARIGLTRDKQMPYINILRESGVLHVRQRENSRWLVGWEERRRILASYPYPKDVDPPPFATRGADTVDTEQYQNRQR